MLDLLNFCPHHFFFQAAFLFLSFWLSICNRNDSHPLGQPLMSTTAAMDSIMCAQTHLVHKLSTSTTAHMWKFRGINVPRGIPQLMGNGRQQINAPDSFPSGTQFQEEFSIVLKRSQWNWVLLPIAETSTMHPHIGFYSFPVLFLVLFSIPSYSCCQESSLKHTACTKSLSLLLIYSD